MRLTDAELTQLRQQLELRQMEAEALADLARQGLRIRDFTELLSLLTKHTVALLGADYAIINAIDQEAEIRHRASCGELGKPLPGPLSSTGLGRAALETGKTLVVTKATKAGRSKLAASPTHSIEGAWSLVAAPVPSHEGLRGVLHAGWRRPFRPGAEEIRLIETLAAVGGGMIDNIQGRELAARRERVTERRLARAALSEALEDASRDVHAMLAVTVRETSRMLRATSSIRLLSDDGQNVQGGAVFDEDAALAEALNSAATNNDLSLSTSLYRSVILDGKPARWFDESGRAMLQTNPAFIREVLGQRPLYATVVAPIRVHGRILGTIGLYQHSEPQPFTEMDEQFLVDIGDRVGLVLENARLFEQLTASRERLEELSQGMVMVQDNERRGIALELHDEIGQLLTAARLLVEAARRLPARLRDERLEEAGRTLDEAIDQVRGLTLDLRPPMLDRFGLGPALHAYLERYTARTGVRVEFQASEPPVRPPAEVEVAAYRIIQEGLTNAARYASVDCAEVRLWADARQLCVRVRDGGAGFDAAALASQPGSGLLGMRERAELLGGELVVKSVPGAGTTLVAELPLKR